MNDMILEYDRALFLFLNGLHNSVFDIIMYWISEEETWIPLYAYLLYLLYKQYGFKSVWLVVLVVVIVVVVVVLYRLIDYKFL